MAEPEPQRFNLNPEVSRAIVSGVILGLVAAAVVWYLERFQTRRMVGMIGAEVEEYLRRVDLVDEAAARLRREREGS